MKQELTVAFRAQDWRVDDFDPSASELFYRVCNFVHGSLLRLWIANNPAFAHLSPAGFELRLYQDDELKVRNSERTQLTTAGSTRVAEINDTSIATRPIRIGCPSFQICSGVR